MDEPSPGGRLAVLDGPHGLIWPPFRVRAGRNQVTGGRLPALGAFADTVTVRVVPCGAAAS